MRKILLIILFECIAVLLFSQFSNTDSSKKINPKETDSTNKTDKKINTGVYNNIFVTVVVGRKLHEYILHYRISSIKYQVANIIITDDGGNEIERFYLDKTKGTIPFTTNMIKERFYIYQVIIDDICYKTGTLDFYEGIITKKW